MKTYVEKYQANGFACLPVKQDKTPLLPGTWKKGFTPDHFENSWGVGVICGKLSGQLECFDFDNHFGDAKEILTDFMAIPEVKTIYEKYKLPVESSQRGGYHLLFRYERPDDDTPVPYEGNAKLAWRLNADNKAEALIETRGEGGYFCGYPSPGYKVVKNDIFNIAVISLSERMILCKSALSLTEHVRDLIVVKNEYESGDRPGDLYNTSTMAVQEMKDLLTGAGWKQVDGYKWRRPGKKEGISATLGKVAPNVFYVFSSSASPFDSLHGYTPFQVLGLIRYNGDFKAAATSLAQPKSSVVYKKEIPVTEIEKILLGARIDPNRIVERPPTILSIKEVTVSTVTYKRVFTLGNFSCLIGKAKSRKTFLMVLLTSALLNRNASDKFIGELPSSKPKILYFDTEQGEYDCYVTIKRIEKMVGNSMNLRGYSLRQYSPSERCQIIEYAFSLWGNEVGFCAIDGVADLANAINDEDEATRVSTMLLRLTKVYNCHICTIIHQNKNDNFATGHLGSSIMKKAEILISVTKGRDKNVSEVSCDLNRGIDFESFGLAVTHEGLPVAVKISQNEGYKPCLTNDIEDDEPRSSGNIPF